MKRNSLRFLTYVLIVLSVVLPVAVDAQLVPQCNPVPGNANSCTALHLLQLLVNIYNFLLGLAALVAMLFIVWSGIRMFYFGFVEDSSSELGEAKQGLTRAITGVVIVAIAYLVVNTLVILLTGGSLTVLFTKFGIPGIF